MTAQASGPGPRWLDGALQAGLGVLLAAVLLPVGVRAVTDGEVGTAWTVALLAALVVAHAAVPFAHRRPEACFAAGAGAMLVLVLAPDLSGPTAVEAGAPYSAVLLPSGLCFFVLLYAVSARAAAPWPAAALVVALVGCLLALVRLWQSEALVAVASGWTGRLFLGAALAGGTAAAWALGRYRATRAAWITAQAERVAADERRRIAREMHDVVAHSLAVVVSHAEGGRLLVERDPGRAPEVLRTIADTGRDALAEMRGLLGVLRDDAHGEVPQPTLAELPELVEQVRRSGLAVTCTEDGVRRRLGALRELAAYRLVQEALTNVVRHAGPGATASVRLHWDGAGLRVVVDDDGGGPGRDPVAAPGTGPAAGPGRGLAGMRERLDAVGGEVSAGPHGGGWRVDARIPA